MPATANTSDTPAGRSDAWRQASGASARVEDVIVARPAGGEKLTNGFQDLIVVDR